MLLVKEIAAAISIPVSAQPSAVSLYYQAISIGVVTIGAAQVRLLDGKTQVHLSAQLMFQHHARTTPCRPMPLRTSIPSTTVLYELTSEGPCCTATPLMLRRCVTMTGCGYTTNVHRCSILGPLKSRFPGEPMLSSDFTHREEGQSRNLSSRQILTILDRRSLY